MGFCLRGLKHDSAAPSCQPSLSSDLRRLSIGFVCLLLRMIEIAKAMRLKISKRRVSLAAGREEDHRLGALCIPLPPAQTVDRQAKRRRIT